MGFVRARVECAHPPFSLITAITAAAIALRALKYNRLMYFYGRTMDHNRLLHHAVVIQIEGSS